MVRLPSYLRLVRAPNPGPMTLDGTNTWILGDTAIGPPAVLDPGPAIRRHVEAVLQACRGQVSVVLLTHRHRDHSEVAAELAEQAGCGVRAADPDLQIGPTGLADGDRLELPGLSVEVVATPGHTSDSRSLLVLGEDGVSRLLTGDMVLGRGTTVITHPDGDLGAYFTSLDRLEALVAEREVVEILPGHGPVVDDPAGWLAFYRAHRRERLDQVRAALSGGADTPAQVVAVVYADVDRRVWPAAEQSVKAQLAYLKTQGPQA